MPRALRPRVPVRSSRRLRSALVALAFAPPLAAQNCPQESFYEGFHQENVGAALAAQGDEALFGHFDGFNFGYFERQPNDWWIRTQLLITPSEMDPDAMGWSVDLRGDLAIAGDPFDDTLGLGSNGHGAALVYERNGGDWSVVDQLFAAVPSNGDRFGVDVAISDDGTRLGVGATFEGPGGSGAVYVGEKQGDSWVLSAPIVPADPGPLSVFGSSIALLGGRLFVGAPGLSTSYLDGPSAVYVFENIGGVWTQVQKLVDPAATPESSSRFGTRIVGTADKLLVSAPVHPEAVGSGRVFQYELSGSSWVQTDSFTAPDHLPPVFNFGRSLDSSNGRLAVGATGWALTLREFGSTWLDEVAFTYPDDVTYSDFGFSVALYDGGLLVGAPQWDPNGFEYPQNTGAVHSYDLGDVGSHLVACSHSIDLSFGGEEVFLINVPSAPGATFWLLGSVSGTAPLPIGPGLDLPLVPDAYFTHTLVKPNGPLLSDGFGTLGPIGNASATFTLSGPQPASLAGVLVHHAFVTLDAAFVPTFASNAATVELVP